MAIFHTPAGNPDARQQRASAGFWEISIHAGRASGSSLLATWRRSGVWDQVLSGQQIEEQITTPFEWQEGLEYQYRLDT